MRNYTKMERKLRMIEEKLNRLTEDILAERRMDLSKPDEDEIEQEIRRRELKRQWKHKPKVTAENKAHLKKLIKAAIKEQGFDADLNFIDVSRITDMSELFADSKFNGDISEWDVSNVTDMREMFNHSQFNGDISEWDVSNVEDMNRMFFASKFNGDISDWNVCKVNDMCGMFAWSFFGGSIDDWRIRGDCNTDDMFNYSPNDPTGARPTYANW